MANIKVEYTKLRDQLVNNGYEQSSDEVMWNEGVLDSIDNLFQGVNKDVEKLIRLNHF
tara:strand:+ start:9491 stop:9664 length:174 start_codon:yes stop_codon:yes gene_type:complete